MTAFFLHIKMRPKTRNKWEEITILRQSENMKGFNKISKIPQTLPARYLNQPKQILGSQEL